MSSDLQWFWIFMLSALSTTVLAVNPVVWPEMEGAQKPRPEWLVTGQPEPHELVAVERAGVQHVINARDLGEFDAWDEQLLVETLGMAYHHLPIGGADDLDRAAVQAFDRIVAGIGDEPALLHCASGNRIGALFALRAGWLQGKDVEAAIEIGRSHGLSRLEPDVRELLDNLLRDHT